MFKGLDNKKKAELAITLIGVTILVFLVIGQMHKPQVQVSKLMTDSMSQVTKDEGRRTRDESWGRDPFFMEELGAKGRGIEGLALNGIMWDKDNPYAIINNDVVKLGDKAGDMTVIDINEKNVILERNSQKYTLELNVY